MKVQRFDYEYGTQNRRKAEDNMDDLNETRGEQNDEVAGSSIQCKNAN